MSTIRLLLAYSLMHDLKIQQLDIKNAFVNGTLKEKFFMRQPEESVDMYHPNQLCLLEKTLYGLKQATRE